MISVTSVVSNGSATKVKIPKLRWDDFAEVSKTTTSNEELSEFSCSECDDFVEFSGSVTVRTHHSPEGFMSESEAHFVDGRQEFRHTSAKSSGHMVSTVHAASRNFIVSNIRWPV